MQRAEGFGQSPPYVIQGGPSTGDKGPGDRDDGLQGHRTSKQHYRGRENRTTPPPNPITNHRCDFKHRGRFFFLIIFGGLEVFLLWVIGAASLIFSHWVAKSARFYKYLKSPVEKRHRECLFVSLLARFRLILQQLHRFQHLYSSTPWE